MLDTKQLWKWLCSPDNISVLHIIQYINPEKQDVTYETISTCVKPFIDILSTRTTLKPLCVVPKKEDIIAFSKNIDSVRVIYGETLYWQTVINYDVLVFTHFRPQDHYAHVPPAYIHDLLKKFKTRVICISIVLTTTVSLPKITYTHTTHNAFVQMCKHELERVLYIFFNEGSKMRKALQYYSKMGYMPHNKYLN